LHRQEAVLTFLKEHAAYICAECLASRVELALPQTMMVTLGLQQVEKTEDLCSLCHGRARVIRAEIANDLFASRLSRPRPETTPDPASAAPTASASTWKRT